jgi:thiamine-monophosphate kinase
MKTTLHQLGERGLIALLKRQLPRVHGVRVGIGDDCAAVQIGCGEDGRLLLLKTDAVVEGVHFDRRATPFQVGWKAMARPLSDFAAMAGRPRWALVTAALRGEMPVRFVREIYRGLTAAAKKFGVTIVGGETVRAPDSFWLNVALAGEVEPQAMKLRSGARPNDAIFVTGSLGGSIAGKHLRFTPRIAEAQWLAKQGCVRAMIDLSDGLARDLGHICRESGVSAVIWKSAIPIATVAGRSLERALRDGEDFELLFTVPSRQSVVLKRAWRRKFPRLRLSLIGFTTCGEGIRFLNPAGGMQPLNEDGYDHFQPRHA